jgi:hypothetical protein
MRLGSSLSIGNDSSPTDMRIAQSRISVLTTGTMHEMVFYPAGTDASKSMTLQYDTGSSQKTAQMHGSWTISSAAVTSDRRLKVEILPLYRKMMGSYAAVKQEETGESTAIDTLESLPKHEQVLSVIRELRPVAYKMKSQNEAKHSQYGFIAQEIEHVLPNIVKTNQKDGMKALYYVDLIAVITLGLQSLDERMLKLDGVLTELEQKQDSNYTKLAERLDLIGKMIKRVLKKTPKVILPSFEKNITNHEDNYGANSNLSDATVNQEGFEHDVVVPIEAGNAMPTIDDVEFI